MNARLPAILFLPLAILAACGEDAGPTTDEDGRESSGEVLEGTISDAMLPLDQVRSQAPLAESEAGDTDDGAEADGEEEEDS
ncbi:hypothetical protein [Aurantiacibacter aquimixticola]|uniref:Argininosuccinate lyase n=1 Tax=Aurantiacibacter aquimixticola TaxID=1958945 RepID=A0A419RTR4_9SPHN|nr:hypothetical protein [Aurantiacibacter aquimixticola]RJY09183.1 hypothetical protein D6201_07255 [Aurantiacibacter aquimixticola]